MKKNSQKSNYSLKHLFLPGRHNFWRPRAFRHHLLSIYSIGLLLSQFSFGITLSTPVATSPDNLKSEIFNDINQQREKKSITVLKQNLILEEAAKQKLQDMFSKNYWDHTSPDGTKAWDFIAGSGYTYDIAGENLARGFISAERMTQAWMNSPTHRANILNTKYDDTGIAVGNGYIDGRLTTVAVQLFASPSTGTNTNQTLIAGEQSQFLESDLANPISDTRLPFFVIYLAIFGLIIFDGIMLKVNGLHHNKKHLWGFRLSLALNVLVLAILLINYAYIL